MAALMAEHRVTVIAALAMFVFFLWMDITLYYKIQSLSPVFATSSSYQPTKSVSFETPESGKHLFTPFKGLSIKLMMMDQANNYVFEPLAEVFDESSQFSANFTFITADIISFMGIICAFIAAWLMVYDSFAIHRLAVLFFQLRTFFDALDGVVARYHLGIKRHISLRYTSGYMVDAICDTIGFTAFLIGCYFFLRRNLPKRHCHQYLPLQVDENKDHAREKPTSGLVKSHILPQLIWTSRQVFFVVICFGLQLACAAFFWNRYIEAYHQLIEYPTTSNNHATLQNEVLRSSLMWVIMWFWRISSSHSLMQLLLLAVFFNRLWDFLTWIQYIGFVELFALAFFTEIHLHDVESYLSASATT